MSRLARRVAVAAGVVLSLQLLGGLALQVAMSSTVQVEVMRQFTRGMEQSGALVSCADRPGPWSGEDGWWSAWPLAADGRVVGEGAPIDAIALPAVGTFAPQAVPGARAAAYASPSAGCGGVLFVQRSRYPLLEAHSAGVTRIVIARVGLALLAGVVLVIVTALPLVRRVRGLAMAMRGVVARDFDGAVSDRSDDELGEVATAFDAAAETARARLQRLEHRDGLLRRALADLAHDLRTPLATLQLSASSLPASPAAAAIRSELGFLEGMTRNFEALLGGDEEGVRVPVALDDLVVRVGHRFAPLARDRGLSFETALPDEPLHAEADPVALERALSNLAQNALRFARGHVVILLYRDGDQAHLEVRDDGPGLGDVAQRAAERGVRGEGAAEQGLGLGLAIAEATARRHGGQLELHDDEAGGAVVAIVLPRRLG